ncbi:Gfo/Idh/MocA family oxidoreductase [Oligosphaera ethanolica]|uniref:Dehydrogenase n=1 Tax=Oligosphaera ethanolica TaxID=760260 RepID=A0AAE3VDE3_9BACT|nr:Gfo/Idh/MocA family oxidoreductase [Oligosphaera ethanolica]MDQ0288169.1 putative dehydrogenase [Oligosphaera ethanolica]
MSDLGMTRRSFLGTSALAGTALTIIPRSVLAAPGRPGANDRINHAIIGVGGMGNAHIGYVLKDPQAKLVAVCDVRKSRRDAAVQRAGADCHAYLDFREMLDRESIDVVHVVTPPHWHALQNIAALNAGCDVWAEKPMTRTIAEGTHVADAVRRNGRVFRLNTWFRLYGSFYGLGTTVAPLKKLVQSGALGWPLTVRVSALTGFSWKASMWTGKLGLPPEPVPADIDYDRWLGPAPWKPYTTHRTSGSFRGYWDYDGGGLADMGQHYLDPVQYILDKDDTSPVEIEATAPWPQHPDVVGLWGQVYMKYADGCKIILESCEWGARETAGKPFIEGPNGKVFQNFRTEPANLAQLVKELPEPAPQVSDFNVSVRTRRTFGLNELNGNRSNILVHLANCAIRSGRKLHFDPATLRFVNDPEANRLAEQPMRAPWRIG